MCGVPCSDSNYDHSNATINHNLDNCTESDQTIPLQPDKKDIESRTWYLPVGVALVVVLAFLFLILLAYVIVKRKKRTSEHDEDGPYPREIVNIEDHVYATVNSAYDATLVSGNIESKSIEIELKKDSLDG